MTIFKEFLYNVASGARKQDLFLFKNSIDRERAKLDLFNEAGELGLCPILRTSDSLAIIGDSIAIFRIAHDKIADQLAGMSWSAIHGLDTLDGLEDGEATKQRLLAWVRPGKFE